MLNAMRMRCIMRVTRPQKKPMLGVSTAMRLRWSGWKGTTMLMIARALVKRSSRLIVVGDSMGGQLYRAMQCGLGRYGGTKGGGFKEKLIAGLDEYTIETVSFSLPPEGARSPSGGADADSTAGGTAEGGRSAATDGGVFELAFINANNVKEKKDVFLNRVMKNFDAVVYNEGLWYNRMWGDARARELYSSKMRPVLHAMQQEAAAAEESATPVHANAKLLMFKETSAQHFFSFNGDGSWESFNKEAGDACWEPDTIVATPNFNNNTCNPRLLVRTCSPTPEGSNWRNEVINEILEHDKLDKVQVLKWFDYTLPRWDLHEDQRNISIAKKGKHHQNLRPRSNVEVGSIAPKFQS